jgi:hypothetical protein
MKNASDKTLGKLANLLTLVIGLGIGFTAGVVYHPRQEVQAQTVQPPAPTVKDVSPVMISPSIGTNLLLAHEIATDSLVVNGYDLLKMQQGIINYLASRPLAENADFLNIINNARSSTAYRIKPPQTAPTPVPAPNTEKPK